ncbi:hypothetical protein PILCRDRAFT_828987 [Piloderma croceum F 1598]|uniref:Uncharacterized protein n=1 Tax=Piloderma croceum (strain F 1598) TaxID=765440 RepID=A0A0C3EM17_PILCF|nr:hypothetical protein PILCRDRAFT_828987 [Piloderma croceum F 1598]
MAANDDSNSLPAIHTVYTAPDVVPPSPVESQYFYYGIPSQPPLVARSSLNVWLEPTGPEAYLLPKESSPIGLHPLREIWEATVGPAMVGYLDSKGVKWTSLDPVRMGYAGESSPPVIVWMGVVPGSISGEEGVKVATHCKCILSAHDIDVHIEIHESMVIRSAGPKMYKPVPTSNATARAREPFSTALGLPICAEVTPSIQGTGGFFVSYPLNPGKIYLVTARHVVFHPDETSNELYQHCNSSQRRRNVLLFGDAAIEKHITATESEISGKHIIIEQLERRLEDAKRMDEEDAEAERNHVLPQLEEARKAIGALEKFHADVSKDWKKQENRILGYVVLSPPIGLGVGEEGFTEDWAVIEIDDSKVDSTNFVGNVIDLSTTIPIDVFTAGMFPHPANPPSFKYPGNRLLKFSGTISDEEMYKPAPKTLDHDNDPCIMVIKRSYASDLTVGRLNNICSFTRVYFKGQSGQMSKEVTVLPHNSKSGAFSRPGDCLTAPTLPPSTSSSSACWSMVSRLTSTSPWDSCFGIVILG